MLHSVKELQGYSVGASDGELGSVSDVYFDDERWAVRYLVVETGGWLSGRKVLISPTSVRGVNWPDEVVNVGLSQQQVRNGPGIDTSKPVVRQHEIEHADYYGYLYYWKGSDLWGPSMYPIPSIGASQDAARAQRQPRDSEIAREERESVDSHLRSCKEVIAYKITASDGPMGSVENFVFDDESWAIRYMVVDTRKWLPGKHVLISPEWIDNVSWGEHEVLLNLTRRAVESSPEYDPSQPISREHEAGLYEHYGRVVYWP